MLLEIMHWITGERTAATKGKKKKDLHIYRTEADMDLFEGLKMSSRLFN